MKRNAQNESTLSFSQLPGWLSLDLNLLFERTRLFILLSVSVFGTIACEDVPCTSDPVSRIGIEFYDGLAAGLVPKKYPISQIRIRNSGLFSNTVSQTASAIRIRFPSNSDSFWLIFSDTTSKDSVRFSYSRTMEFAGESCGYYYGFKDLKVDSISGARFDNAQIVTNQGDSSNKVHVRIFW